MSSADDEFDAEADNILLGCLDLRKPISFFQHAGAGSGKTRSLVKAIRNVCENQGDTLTITGKKIGVITYTNAARDEIRQRLQFDQRVVVSTIHSFAWSLIEGYNSDIREWLSANLQQDISGLEEAEAKGRAGTKASIDRIRSIESKKKRLDNLKEISRFIYSPASDNKTRDSLNHSEVIAATAEFLASKPTLGKLLVARFPILLIDESQDTNRSLMDAFISLENRHRGFFCLGLFGDTMQRIYTDGKENLENSIPSHWARPTKRMNHRCPQRVVELINKVRHEVDGESQNYRSDAEIGTVRLFIVHQDLSDKTTLEIKVAEEMAKITGDQKWSGGAEAIKTLALEHLMSARRFGFDKFFSPLYSNERLRTSALEGSGAGIGLFTREILPLVAALKSEDRFTVAAIMRRSSPLLNIKALEQAGEKQAELLIKAREACAGLAKLLTEDGTITARSALIYAANANLFSIPDVLKPFSREYNEADLKEDANEEGDENVDQPSLTIGSELYSWSEALEAPLDQVERYDRYINGNSQFDTHQGVKGLEFPRVMVVVSDQEARGFMFAYDKLFGVQAKSQKDIENEEAGKDTSIHRTRRLFYVTCSRAGKSLAVVYYTAEPKQALAAMRKLNWFTEEETVIIEAAE